MAESRDPEEVREILSRYFAEARTVVERYGGTVEKFIGDAVMAVWGVPVAHEDDAERAVRAGLDLVAEVIALGEELGVTGLTMRVGIVTGEVAVTLGAVGEGMVAGRRGQHRRAGAGGRRTRAGLGRRRDPVTDRRRGRLRRRRRAPAQGQVRAAAPVRGARRRRRDAWQPARRRSRGTLHRPRPRAAAGQGALPLGRRGRPAADGRRVGDRRRRQVPARLGVREVRRRDRRHASGGTAVAPCPTATASRSGRSPRWCAPGSASPTATRRPSSSSASTAALAELVPDAAERDRLAGAPRACCSVWRGAATLRRTRARTCSRPGPRLFEKVAAGRARRGPALRGHAVRRQRSARLHRAPRGVRAVPGLRARRCPGRSSPRPDPSSAPAGGRRRSTSSRWPTR